MAQPDVDLSVVIPVRNEEANVGPLLERLLPVLAGTGLRCEIVWVNDGSTDGTLARLREARAAAAGVTVVVIDLSRNFGKEAAVSAGLDHARGRAVVPIDGDLQDPPELITEMIALWRGGAEVVCAVRSDRRADPALKRLTAWLFYRVFNAVSRHAIPAGAGDFRLMDRKVVLALRRLPERTRLMKGLFAWVGFRQATVSFTRAGRGSGRSSWSGLGLVRLALDGIFSFSSLPLRVWALIGTMIAGLSFSYGVFLIVRVLIYGRDVPGYASLMVVSLFAFGVQLITLGTIGEYLGRVFEEVKQRPLYIVREVEDGSAPPVEPS